jgi:hypothetical protein
VFLVLANKVFWRTGAREGIYVIAMSSFEEGARRRRRNKGSVGFKMSDRVWMLLNKPE